MSGSTTLEEIRLPYKQGDHDNDISAWVVWSPQAQEEPRPIGMPYGSFKAVRQAGTNSALALIFRAGGFAAASSDAVPEARIEYLCSHGFVAVLPDRRPDRQASSREPFQCSEDAFDWTICTLPALLAESHNLDIDVGNVVALG